MKLYSPGIRLPAVLFDVEDRQIFRVNLDRNFLTLAGLEPHFAEAHQPFRRFRRRRRQRRVYLGNFSAIAAAGVLQGECHPRILPGVTFRFEYAYVV